MNCSPLYLELPAVLTSKSNLGLLAESPVPDGLCVLAAFMAQSTKDSLDSYASLVKLQRCLVAFFSRRLT